MTYASIGTEGVRPTAAVLEGPHASDFEIVSDGCAGTTLAGGQSCAIGVRFEPVSVG